MSALSRIARDWAERSFGKDHVDNLAIRALRTVEEAIELCQALGTPKEVVLRAVDTVYSRPVGEPQQELGGTLMTTVILCEAMGEDHEEILEREIRRVLQKPPKHFAERNQQKIDMGLTTGTCTRDHECGTPQAGGPCNGEPRPVAKRECCLTLPGEPHRRTCARYAEAEQEMKCPKCYETHFLSQPCRRTFQ